MTALLSFTVGVLAGIGGYYLADRFTVLPHITVRALRHAGWRAERITEHRETP